MRGALILLVFWLAMAPLPGRAEEPPAQPPAQPLLPVVEPDRRGATERILDEQRGHAVPVPRMSSRESARVVEGYDKVLGAPNAEE